MKEKFLEAVTALPFTPPDNCLWIVLLGFSSKGAVGVWTDPAEAYAVAEELGIKYNVPTTVAPFYLQRPTRDHLMAALLTTDLVAAGCDCPPEYRSAPSHRQHEVTALYDLLHPGDPDDNR